MADLGALVRFVLYFTPTKCNHGMWLCSLHIAPLKNLSVKLTFTASHELRTAVVRSEPYNPQKSSLIQGCSSRTIALREKLHLG